MRKLNPSCGAKSNRTSPIAWVILIAIIIVFGIPLMKGYNNAHDNDNNSQTSIIVENKDEYILKCKEYFYEEIARNPNKYKDSFAKFNGKVIQVVENKDKIVLRVNVTNTINEYIEDGLWSDTIYVEYKRLDENESRILENDIITLYGTLNGIKTYETVLGTQESIPYLIAKYIDIN